MFCKSCGTKLDESWKVCPKCAAPVDDPAVATTQSEKTQAGPLAGICIALICLGLLVTCAGPASTSKTSATTSSRTAAPAKKQILVAAKVDTRNILVYNGNDFDWIAPRITIFDGMSGYSLNADTIKAKEQKIFHLTDFVNGANRFDGRKTRPDQITVSTETAGGGMKLQQ